MCAQLGQGFLVGAEIHDVLVGHLVLEVGLTVEVLGLDVADALPARGRQQHQVCREKLLLSNLDDVAHADILPGLSLELLGLLVKYSGLGIVLEIVCLVALYVFK